MAASRSPHTVPTHLRTTEILITLAGLSLSVKQFLLILTGIALSYQVWLLLDFLTWVPAGQVLRWVATSLPLCAALAFAFVSLAARSLEVWCVVMLRFALRPRRFVWRSVRFSDPGLAGMMQEESDGENSK